MDWYVYIIKSKKGKLYTGITNHLLRRFKQHLHGPGGAKFFRLDPPDEVVYIKILATKSQALKLEYEIKKMKRENKLEFIKKGSHG